MLRRCGDAEFPSTPTPLSTLSPHTHLPRAATPPLSSQSHLTTPTQPPLLQLPFPSYQNQHPCAKLFAQVLPRYFKHNKLGSFSQQLHTYGFRRKANASSLDSSVEFFHDQYTAAPADFLAWIRAGGAVSKRVASAREVGTAPPPGLIIDMRELDDGIRQMGQMFQQARAIHAVQLRTVISKLTVRGLLSPDSASYISSLPPATPMLSAAHLQQVAAGVAPAAVAQSMLGGGAFGRGGCGNSCGSALGGGALGASGFSGGSFSSGALGGSASAGFYGMEEQTLAQLGGSGSGFGRFSMVSTFAQSETARLSCSSPYPSTAPRIPPPPICCG